MRQGFYDCWDRLGLVVAMSLTGTLALTLALSLPYLIPPHLIPHGATAGVALLIGCLAGVALFVLPMAGAFQIAHQIATHDEVSYGDFLRAGWRLYRPAITLLAIDLAVAVGLAANFVFYLKLGGLFGLVAMLFCLYLLLFWCLMALSHFPLLIAQEAGLFDTPERPARRGALPVLRRALYLTLGRPFYALGLGALVLPLSALCLLSGVLLALFWLGLIALLLTQANRALLIQFAVLPPPPPQEAIIPDEQFRIKVQHHKTRQD